VRFTGVTGRFSTWAVAIVEPLPTFDTTPPTITLHDDITVEATGPSGATVTYTEPAVTDDVDGTVPVACLPASGTVFPLGKTAVSCSAADTSGNQATSSFDVIVRDTTAPTIDVPADMTVAAPGAGGAVVSFAATATDVVDGVTPADCTPPSGSLFPVGVTTVVCVASDTAGNVAGSADFDVTVLAPDPVGQLEDLLQDVNASSVRHGLRVALANKLEAALKALATSPPDVVLACDKVDEFARKVEQESAREPGQIPAATARTWLMAAADIGPASAADGRLRSHGRWLPTTTSPSLGTRGRTVCADRLLVREQAISACWRTRSLFTHAYRLPGVASSRHHRRRHRTTGRSDHNHLSGTVTSMADDRVWTAEELERLSPDERDRIVREGTVSDLSQVPADFLARARAKGRALLEERGVITTDGS